MIFSQKDNEVKIVFTKDDTEHLRKSMASSIYQNFKQNQVQKK